MSEHWISVQDALPNEVQAYGWAPAPVMVRNDNSGFEGYAYMVRAVDGEKWLTEDGKFELVGVTRWRYL